jgi:hypothetical protein
MVKKTCHLLDENETSVGDYQLSLREREELRPLACDALIFGKYEPR